MGLNFNSLYKQMQIPIKQLVGSVRLARLRRPWLMAMVVALLIIAASNMLDGGSWSWLLFDVVLMTIIIGLLVRQHFMLKRIEALEQQVVQLAKTERRTRLRSKRQQKPLARFFDDTGQTLH